MIELSPKQRELLLRYKHSSKQSGTVGLTYREWRELHKDNLVEPPMHEPNDWLHKINEVIAFCALSETGVTAFHSLKKEVVSECKNNIMLGCTVAAAIFSFIGIILHFF